MFKPTATYRIQFHKGFTFKNLVQILPYLEELGVKTIYASPIFAAAPGSTHGYDVVDPNQINPEIGTEAELIALSKVLKQKGISWLQDIVPNHMAFHSHNAWLMDVLEKWDQSPYFNFFDLNFPTQSTDKRLMVPFLGEDLTEAIDQQKLQLGIKNEKCCFLYGESFWPLNQNSLQLIGNDLGAEKIRAKLPAINQNPQLIHDLADAQYYRLCQWQETDSQLNYRRFFTVNGLICLNIQHEVAFETYHQYIFDLVRRGIFQGLRVDHIDGLADPQGYLERLRSEVGSSTYIVVEKILASDEQLPQNWPVEGTTGYDFLYIVNNLLTNRDAEKKFNQLYREITQKKIKAKEQVILKKRAILDQHMQGELDHLVTLFGSLHLVDKKDLKSLPKDALKLALADFLVHFPVYRSYPEQFPLQDGDRKIVKAIFEKLASGPATDLLADVFLSNRHTENDALLTFFRRCMQFSGPLMAKGVEDTLMYTYNRFIGHAEVGDAPDAFGLSVASFHQKMELRLANWPHTMNATATHDTKRGEDVRARLNVLSDIPEDWEK
ncbi:MAG: malto-oligosyltrehalose synthase, partial [Pedobacter sp.]|nr:malto-oligosyltrehalose synthase [Pedobacter sp.]